MTDLSTQQLYEARKKKRDELLIQFKSGEIETLEELFDIAYAEGLQSVLTEFLNLKMS